MSTMTADDAGRILRKAATLWPEARRFDAGSCRVWAEMLDGLTVAQASAALDRWMRSSPHAPKPADLHAAYRQLAAGTTRTPEPVPGGPRSKPSCGECDHGWITVPSTTVEAGGQRYRNAQTVRPCSRCIPDVHGKWATGQFMSELAR